MNFEYPLTHYVIRKFSIPIANLLVNTSISANSVSWFSFLLGLISCYMIISGQPYISVVFLFASLIFDCVDGDLSRARKKTTKRGYFLDGVLDRVIDSLLIISIIVYYPDFLLLGALVLFTGLLTSYLRRMAESIGIKCNVGIAGRDFRLIIIIILVLFGHLVNGLLFYGFIFLLVFNSITVIHRFIYTYNKTEI